VIGCKFSTEPHPFNNVIKELGLSVFERFTERARQVVVLAQQEARNNKCAYIGTEHILMGLLREEEGLAARVLASMDVEVGKAAKLVAATAQGEPRVMAGQIPMTPRTKKALELARREALSLGHNYIGTEHILLGLVRDLDSRALHILQDNFQLDPEKIRAETIRMLSGPKAPILRKDHRENVQAEADRIEKERLDKLVDTLDELKKTEELLELLCLAVTLGRQFPDHPAERVARAARDLHG
jgi:ATP-dependent Clp protease ATP-binding subunit ClpA